MIAIPNMELPPWCGKCILQDGEICYAINENDIDSGLSFFDLEDLRDFCIKRRDDCQLIDIVQCKDCKHYDTESRSFPCCTDMFGAVRYMEPDGFCSKGERRSK